MNQFGDEMLAFATGDRSQLGKYDVGEEVEPLSNGVKRSLESLRTLKSVFNGRCPCNLDGESDELSRELV